VWGGWFWGGCVWGGYVFVVVFVVFLGGGLGWGGGEFCGEMIRGVSCGGCEGWGGFLLVGWGEGGEKDYLLEFSQAHLSTVQREGRCHDLPQPTAGGRSQENRNLVR